MKRFNDFTRRSISALLTVLALTIIFSAARAQTVIQQVTCVAPDPTDATRYIAYFGYTNTSSETQFIPSGTSRNFYYPLTTRPDAPSTFYPGIHRKVNNVSGIPRTVNETWELDGVRVVASFQPGMFCGGNITYQGRLSNANAAASGNYDLRFQVFDALTGGTAQGDALTIAATVTNGVFTVALDSDLLGIPREQTGQLSTYLEISVRQGTAAFATLAPRQPITATPFAINAITANSATNVSGGFVQLPLTTGAPPASECNAASQYGRQKVDATDNKLYICTSTGWKSTVLQ